MDDIVDDKLLENYYEIIDNLVKCDIGWWNEGEDNNCDWVYVSYFFDLFFLCFVFYFVKWKEWLKIVKDICVGN